MQFPHCDPKILHAPNECEFCDKHPKWQKLRETWGINFTGKNDPDKIKCPAEQARPLDTIERWGGNVAYKEETEEPKMCTTSGRPVDVVRAEQTESEGQHKDYIVLCPDERAKGFVRPYRDKYIHVGVGGSEIDPENPARHGRKGNGCGVLTRMGRALSETYARDPKFYSHTFCCGCNTHLPVHEFVWEDGTVVGE